LSSEWARWRPEPDFPPHELRMPKSLLDRRPLVAAHPQASVWLKIQSDLGLAQRTLDAYGRALDVGYGYCTYSFFEQCPHRMACPRCDFYVTKGSSKAQLLEAKANLQRMLVEI